MYSPNIHLVMKYNFLIFEDASIVMGICFKNLKQIYETTEIIPFCHMTLLEHTILS